MPLKTWGFAVALAGLCAPSVLAHHSSAEYDRSRSLTLQATVVEFHYANPHPMLFVDAKEEDGSVARWTVEIGPGPAELLRMGWDKKRSEAALAAGTAVTVTLTPSKRVPSVGIATKIIAADGEQVFGAAVHLEN